MNREQEYLKYYKNLEGKMEINKEDFEEAIQKAIEEKIENMTEKQLDSLIEKLQLLKKNRKEIKEAEKNFTQEEIVELKKEANRRIKTK